ncbi:DNA polymerase III subunit alpha [Periweissella ghanensis]|uniref:DNA polymerase III subunit alpha n=1 Tax=Periweissella ghanensis TaxID=467997 RepID=A0ABM8Z9P2_9LACO|nr:DNA polymerase III subunit alpha [Periweissella ghanensis]CAH0418182.1 DNA polymerase III subunit alpha [Periweissella ghanensis]
MSYFPIQALSAYSLLKSPTTPQGLVTKAKALGYQNIALTDIDVMYGVVDFYNAAIAAKLKPILGLTLKVNGLVNQNTIGSIILIAKNAQGYQNLMKISSYKMTLTNPAEANLAAIAPFLSDLFVISPVGGEIDQLIQQSQVELATQVAHHLMALFDAAAVYLGINLTQSAKHREQLQAFSAQVNLPLVVDEPVHYLEPTDYFASRVLQAIDANIVLTNLGQSRGEVGADYLKPFTNVQTAYANAGLTTAFNNNTQLADQIAVDLKFKQPQLPTFPLPTGTDTREYLAEISQAGLRKRGLTSSEYQARLTHELTVIDQLGFNDYFLIVWDVMEWAHQQKIQTGPGRGSAAGSLVAYALAITDVDPIAYDLLFERFLNPERAQMPDIDLDLPDNRREEVLNYVHDKYGHTHVAQIITFGTLAAKQVIRDTGRVFGYTQPQLAQLAKALPNAAHVTLANVIEKSRAFQNVINDLPNGPLLLNVAQQLEGLPRNYSTHAAGVVISQGPLTDIVPVQTGPDNRLMTQLPKNPVEALGLLKMDFLGLRNLTLLATTLSAIHTSQPDFDLDKIPYDDQATLALFQTAKTNGVFQFESDGIKQVLRQLQPDSFEMIAAVNALFRPGPMENISQFVARKHGQEPVTYPDEVLAPILAPTFGIIVYQEQVMRVASALAGFTLAQADMLRRAISKKDAQKINVLRQQFIDGASALGHAREVAITVYDYIEAFANYGFNRSHAVAYSKMAYQLAFLKVHFPREFFIALINANAGNDAKVGVYIQELRQAGVTVVGPDINRSTRDFASADGAVRFGLSAIKGLRSDFINELLIERDTNGRFESLPNLISRLSDKWRNETLITALIKAGACDNLGYNRKELLQALNGILEAVGLSGSSMSLFASMAPKIAKLPDFSLAEKLAMEVEMLGVYVSAHPVEQYRKLAQQIDLTTINQLHVDEKVNLVILITRIHTIRTKTGKEMAFLTATDQTGEISITLFPNLYQQLKKQIATGQVFVLRGKVEQNRELQIVADYMKLARDIKVKNNANISENPQGQWFLKIAKDKNQTVIENELRQILQANPGENPVIIVYEIDNRKILMPKQWWLKKNQQLMQSLTSLLGQGNVIFKEK